MHTCRNFLSLPHHHSRSLSLLFAVSLFRSFGYALIGIFLPIFFYRQLSALGYDSSQALLGVGLYFLWFELAMGLALIPAVVINTESGAKGGFIVGLIGDGLFMIGLFLLSRLVFPLQWTMFLTFLSMIVAGIAAAHFWMSYHTYFVEVGDRRFFGKEIGLVTMLSLLTGILAPLFASVALTIAGFPLVFAVAIGVIGVAIGLAFWLKGLALPGRASFLRAVINIKRFPTDFGLLVCAGAFSVIQSVIWPIFLFAIIGNYLNIGILATAVALAAALASLAIGRQADHTSAARLEKVGSYIGASTFLGKIIFQFPVFLFLFDSVYQIFSPFVFLPLDVVSYKRATNGHAVEYLVFREVALRVGDILGLTVFAAIVVSGLPYWWSFVGASVFALAPVLLIRRWKVPAVRTASSSAVVTTD